MSETALRMHTRIVGDPRLVSAAGLLDIPPAFLLGSLLHLMAKALDYAEDGDLWRGDEGASARFIAACAGWRGDAALFVSVLRQEGWLNGWMIADWLLYAGDHLYRKHKTRNRDRLVEIYAKNGREYGEKRGRNTPGSSGAPERKHAFKLLKGSDAEVGGVKVDEVVVNEVESDTAIMSEAAADEANMSGNEAIMDGDVVESGGGERPHQIGESELVGLSPDALLEQGIALSLDQLDGSGLTHLEVFSAFRPVLVFHAVATLNSFYYRCVRCRCTPARWTMVYMDKVHAVYRARPEGQPWLEDGADPVALTMAALLPAYGRRHSPTEAARQLFLEIMMDYQRQKDGQASRWKGCVSGNFIAHELSLRKGRAGKIA